MIRSYLPTLMFLLGTAGCTPHDPDAASSWEHSATGLYAAAMSSDGRYAVVSNADHHASYWDLGNNVRLYDWRHDDSGDAPISNVAFATDDSHVITTDATRFVIWSVATGEALGYWSVDAPINDVALSDGARFVLLGLTDGRSIHIDRRTQRRLEVVAHQGERVSRVALTADGAIAATGGNDGRVMVWDAHTGRELHAFEHRTRIAVVTFDTAGERLFAADESGNAHVWTLATGERRSTLTLPQRQTVISAARFSRDGSRLLLGFPGRDVRLWNTRDGRLIGSWQAPVRQNGWIPQGSTVYAVAFNEADATVVAESSNGLGRAWRAGLN